jgi:hypothetical protein
MGLKRGVIELADALPSPKPTAPAQRWQSTRQNSLTPSNCSTPTATAGGPASLLGTRRSTSPKSGRQSWSTASFCSPTTASNAAANNACAGSTKP